MSFNRSTPFFLDGSLGDAVYCVQYMKSLQHKKLIIFCSKSIAKKVLIAIDPTFNIYTIPIGGFFFRALIANLISALNKFRPKKLAFYIFNKKSFVCKKYQYRLHNRSITSHLLKNNNYEIKNESHDQEFILINCDVDSSISKKFSVKKVRPTKMPSPDFFAGLLTEIKKVFPGFKFIQIGAQGNPIHGVDVNLVGKTSIVELVELVKKSKYVVTVEGGVRALAIHFGKDGLSIEGPTSSSLLPKNSNFIDYHPSSCPPCWRLKSNWFAECATNKGGNAVCTSDELLIPHIPELKERVKNAIR